MFAKTTNVGFAQRVVATLVAGAIVLWSIGLYTTAQAANLTTISDTLSDSDVSVVSDHTINFTVPTSSPGLLAGETMTVTFPAGFAGVGSIAFGDVDIRVNGVDETVAAVAAPGVWGVAGAGQVLTITSNNTTLSATDVVEIQIGTNATFGVTGSNQITNPTAGSYEIVVTAGAVDTGKTRVAIIDNVLVTAIVDTAFDFTIDGLATSTAINGTSTTGSTTPTLIDFGTLVAGEIKTLAQALTVTTNARNGFVVTVNSDGDLESSTGAIIDNFDEGSDVSDTGTAWNSPVPTINDETSWGHWGMTSSDADLNSLGGFYSGEFGANEYIAASTTPRQVFHHDGPSDGSTTNIGAASVGYQIEITPLQEAADDYNTTLTYVATPTF